IQVVVMPATFYVAATQWGIDGVAIAWLIVHPLITIPPFLLFTLHKVNVTGMALLRALWPAISSGLAMVVGTWGVQTLMAGAGAPVRLFVTVAAGGVIYVGSLLLFHRRRLFHVVSR